MGCFSYYCKGCGDTIKDGEGVKLFLLQHGKVLEEQQGKYSNYGTVQNEEDTDDIDWRTPWSECCELHWSPDTSSGIAAYHFDCYSGKVPTERSSDDPEQGCGDARHLNIPETLHEVYAEYSDEKSEIEVEEERKMQEMSAGLSDLLERAEALLAKIRAENEKKNNG